MTVHLALLFVTAVFAHCLATDASAQPQPHQRLHLERLPASYLASKDKYYNQLKSAGAGMTFAPYYILAPTLQRWKPGATINVAFEEGSPELHSRIEQAAKRWITQGGANIHFSFKDNAGRYRKWSANDTAFAADIRIRFVPESANEAGYWSHVGRDSVNRKIKGGAPAQASMQFDGFLDVLPSDWDTIVMHEFGHALGFEHEHQNPVGGCDFRYLDDPGYMPTPDANGMFIPDAAGRRPGLYTYLGGEPNNWKKEVTDANLGNLQVSSAFLVGDFDKRSIMKYFFDPSMFISGENSPCYTKPDTNATLSVQDIAGVRRAYPNTQAAITFANQLRINTIDLIKSSAVASQELKGSLQQQRQSIK